MKNFINVAVCAVFIFGFALLADAESTGATFNVSLGRNSTQSAEVLKLQQFLFDRGYLSVRPTGAFLSLTFAAVQAFQKANGIETTGFFGPLSRAAANRLAAGGGVKSTGPAATITAQSVKVGGSDAASALLWSQKTITWQTNNYPQGVGVNINLLRKISDNPRSLVLVRKIATDTPNDSQEAWIPQAGESGNDLYIEVTCSSTHQFQNGCSLSGEPVKVN